uniref:Copper transport protein n=1 Tax=Steinernema glaseri TaxID=37863 RepID=A0A1I7YPY8_9BILA
MDHSHHGHPHDTIVPATQVVQDGGHGGHMGGHAMAFHFGSNEVVLFDFWKFQTPLGLLISCNVIVALCFLLESVRWFRVFRRHQRQNPEDDVSIVKRINAFLLADVVLFALQLTLGYALMLIFMTFNVWLCAATVLGEALANMTFRVLFPKLEASAASAATVETCCG